MLDALKFVQGAVAKKDFLPAMTHFVIENGFVRSFNGTLALCSPIPLNINCKPNAEQFIKAISNCKDVVTLTMTPAKRLKVVSGKFKAFVDCVDEETLHAVPEGERVEFDSESFYAAIKTLGPIVGNDAMRSWCNGVLFKGQSAFATNNIVLAEYWTGVAFPKVVNVPRTAIKEILRIGKPPQWAQVTDNSITFHFEDSRWIRSQLLEAQWPDLSQILDAEQTTVPTDLDPQIYDAIENLDKFGDKLSRIYFKNGIASTTKQDDEEGAFYEMDNFKHEGIYQMDMLELIRPIAKKIHFDAYPKPCVFYGDNIRGAIVGMRM